MLNSLADSDFMRLFNPKVNFDDKKTLKITGISKNADFFYKSNIFVFDDKVNFEGIFDDSKFNGVIGNLTRKIQSKYQSIIVGNEKHYLDWLTFI